MALSGAWLARSQEPVQVPLKPGIDPEHLHPTPNPQFSGLRPQYASTAPAPDLPAAWVPPPVPALPTGSGPVDRIVRSPAIGVGTGAGLSLTEAQDQARGAHLADDGSYAQHRWSTPNQRTGVLHVEVVPDTISDGDSPRTVTYQETGVGAPHDDGNSRLARREKRWVDDTQDWHRYPVTFRPLAPKYAHPPVEQYTPGADQQTIHTHSVVGWNPGAPDRFVAPLVRRTPGRWDEPLSYDGTASTVAGAVNAYGLTQWGL